MEKSKRERDMDASAEGQGCEGRCHSRYLRKMERGRITVAILI